jgi:GT2 family glycosyltransferase
VKIVTTEGLGLAGAANLGVRSSSGEYVIRLDADDYFDENILLVLSNYLDVHPNVGMVFCDYYTVDTHGEIIEQRRRAKLNSEVELLDRPALAAGAMYRRSCFDRIGGYDESLRYQEDYDFWIKFIEKFVVRNVSLPLMYYRMHGSSMSRNWEGRMKARRAVKQRFVEANRDRHASKILAIVPARADILDGKKLPLLPLGTSDLLGRAIDSLTGCDLVDRIVVSTEDQDTADRAKQLGVDVPYLRSRASAGPGV